jgi:hypothetical protein
LTTTVKATRQAPSVMKNAIAFVRLVIRMGMAAQMIMENEVTKQNRRESAPVVRALSKKR